MSATYIVLALCGALFCFLLGTAFGFALRSAADLLEARRQRQLGAALDRAGHYRPRDGR